MKAAPIPAWSLAISGVAAAVFVAPPLQALLVYNREAIGEGEIWRLLTGNLVHFSAMHFVKDVVALLVAGLLIEIRRYRHFAMLCLISGALIGTLLYVAEPAVLVYGGLSGIVVAAVTYLCLQGLREGGAYRWLCLGALLGLAAKTVLELTLGVRLPGEESPGFILVPESHAVGAVTAIALFVLVQTANHRTKSTALKLLWATEGKP